MNKPNTNEVPRPAVRSDEGDTQRSVDVAAQTSGEQPNNSLAGARMPATPTEQTNRPEPAQRANAAALMPDFESDDDTETRAAPGSDDEPPANFVRRPFGSQLPKLAFPQRRGFRRYWFNDKPGRVARAKEAGYRNVEENGQPVARVVQGGGLRAFLMEIPLKFFDDDMKAQQKQVDEIERAIRSGDMKRNDGDNRYVPKDAIKFRDE
jgi:hypothetical protein